MAAAFRRAITKFRERRAWIAVAVLCVTALANARLLRDGFGPRDTAWDVARYDELYESVRRDIPPHSDVGYLGPPGEAKEKFVDLQMTRFALAAHRVVAGPNRPWVVSRSKRRPPAASGLVEFRTYPNGISLYAHEERP